ncbi:hypothetical protein [Virgibacillus pantothenticus]|uniref:hypothetical protein n=1 Tax=Virgibacillus pantothenticus TaxID=1473 RepID=UPI0032046C4B
MGCASDDKEKSDTDSSDNDTGLASERETKQTEKNDLDNEAEDEAELTGTAGSTTTNQSNNGTDSTDEPESREENALSNYSTEEMEYARVWLQLGEIKDVDELNVRHIPAGTPLNPDDETSVNYPDDVIQLAGSRLVDGSLTYSSKGDGTVNVYNVPLRWDGKNSAGEKFYTEIIETTEVISVNPGDNNQIIELIDKMNIN